MCSSSSSSSSSSRSRTVLQLSRSISQIIAFALVQGNLCRYRHKLDTAETARI